MERLSFIHLYSDHSTRRIKDLAELEGLLDARLQLVFVVRSGNPLAGRSAFDGSQLESLTLLMPTDDGVMRPVVDRFLIAKSVGATPNAIEAFRRLLPALPARIRRGLDHLEWRGRIRPAERHARDARH